MGSSAATPGTQGTSCVASGKLSSIRAARENAAWESVLAPEVEGAVSMCLQVVLQEIWVSSPVSTGT